MNLQAWLERQHPLVEDLKSIETLCTAVDNGHKRGIAFYALEPSRITADGYGYCTISETATVEAPQLAPYQAPEIQDGANHTPKADIYTAAAICYEILTGRPPDADEPTWSLRRLRPDLLRDLSDQVMACLARDPDRRPKTLAYIVAVVRRQRAVLPSEPPRPTIPDKAESRPQPSPAPPPHVDEPPKPPPPILSVVPDPEERPRPVPIVSPAPTWQVVALDPTPPKPVPTPMPAPDTPHETPSTRDVAEAEAPAPESEPTPAIADPIPPSPSGPAPTIDDATPPLPTPTPPPKRRIAPIKLPLPPQQPAAVVADTTPPPETPAAEEPVVVLESTATPVASEPSEPTPEPELPDEPVQDVAEEASKQRPGRRGKGKRSKSPRQEPAGVPTMETPAAFIPVAEPASSVVLDPSTQVVAVQPPLPEPATPPAVATPETPVRPPELPQSPTTVDTPALGEAGGDEPALLPWPEFPISRAARPVFEPEHAEAPTAGTPRVMDEAPVELPQPVVTSVLVVATDSEPAPATEASQSPPEDPVRSPVSGLRVAAIALVLLLLAAVGVWRWTRSRPANEMGSTTPPPTTAPLATSPAERSAPLPRDPGRDSPSPNRSASARPNVVATPLPVPPSTTGSPTQGMSPTPDARVASPEPPLPTPAPTTMPVVPSPPQPTPAPELPTRSPRQEQPSPPPAAENSLPAGSERAVLSNVAPFVVRSPSSGILDVHGEGLRPNLQARVLKGGTPAKGISVVRQRFVSPKLMQVVVRVEEGVRPGSYGLALADPQGGTTNILVFQVR